MTLGAPLRQGRMTGDGFHLPLAQVTNPDDEAVPLRVHLVVGDADAEQEPRRFVTQPLDLPAVSDVIIGVALTGAGEFTLDETVETADPPQYAEWRGRLATGPRITNTSDGDSNVVLHMTATTISDGDIGPIVSLVRASRSVAPDHAFRPAVIVQLPDGDSD